MFQKFCFKVRKSIENTWKYKCSKILSSAFLQMRVDRVVLIQIFCSNLDTSIFPYDLLQHHREQLTTGHVETHFDNSYKSFFQQVYLSLKWSQRARCCARFLKKVDLKYEFPPVGTSFLYVSDHSSCRLHLHLMDRLMMI